MIFAGICTKHAGSHTSGEYDLYLYFCKTTIISCCDMFKNVALDLNIGLETVIYNNISNNCSALVDTVLTQYLFYLRKNSVF